VLALAALAVAVPAFIAVRGGSHSTAAAQTPSNAGAFLGVRLSEQNNQVHVQAVVPNGPAAKAGVQSGDVITQIDGKDVHTLQDVTNSLSGKAAGATVSLSLTRNGSSVGPVTVTLGTPPARPAARAGGILGVSVRNATAADQSQYGLTTTNGALIVNVESGGGAAAAGLQAGDLITSINNTTVNNVADLRTALANSKPGDTVTVTYQRKGATQTASVKLGNAPAPGSGGPGGVAPFLPGIGGQSFDRFVSTETKTKDANGTVHDMLTCGGTVSSVSGNTVNVTWNGTCGSNSGSVTVDQNTRIRKPGSNGTGASQLAQGDKVLVTMRDGTVQSIVVANPNGGFFGGRGPGGIFAAPTGGQGSGSGQSAPARSGRGNPPSTY
jgi:membrane-associated protease RseP (regulator of RpoE activity)